MSSIKTVITGTGSYIPDRVVSNEFFAQHSFYHADGKSFETSNQEIIEKFKDITGIRERRYAEPGQKTSDIAAIAAEEAIMAAGIDRESIDQIIFAHNFGDVGHGTCQSDAVPSLGNRVKHLLGIKNPNCVTYDILFGCPGWILGVIQAHAFIQSGQAHRILVIGAETLSRVVDKSDRDTMIFSDGAGASIVEGIQTDDAVGIIDYAMVSHSMEELDYLFMGPAYDPNADYNTIYIKMLGRKIYEYALVEVPKAMKHCLDKAGVSLEQIKKIFIHQANEKMDEAILKRLYRGHDMPPDVMPMSIEWLGNSSVATVITLYDLVLKGKMPQHSLQKGDYIMFASVGAGMNINAIVYRY
jgi:3-oxoacyl-[acyl-carrier-protein] synthase-3